MSAAPKIIDKKSLQALVPFNALSPAHFNEVMQKTQVEEFRTGRVVFKEGDHDNQSIYLLRGELNLLAGNEIVGVVKAGTDAARHPVAQQQPRQVTARAKTNVVIARVDSSLLDIMLTWDQSSGYEVAEIDDDEDDDWMTRILQSQAFLKLPPSNIQRLLMSVESVPVRAGDVIIRQGADGDYFYIIKNGRCMVTRRPSPNAKEVKLAELADGDAFGEDALVSDAKRNATITMMTDGVLMRLAKGDFNELLKEPLLNKVKYKEAEALVAKGAELLDVRLPGEFENTRIANSRNIPLSALRLEANTLARGKKYIVCCDTGRRSASAAFVLSQRGFEVFVLEDGFASVPPEALVGNGPSVGGVVQDAAPVPDLVAQPSQAEAATASTAIVADLEGRIDALQAAQTAAEAARDQAKARVAELQDELERLRATAREQTLELEQTLSEARAEGAALSAEIQQLKEETRALRQADKATRGQAEALEAEVTERREHEAALRAEISALNEQRARLEAAVAGGEQTRAGADAELERLRNRIAELEPLEERLQAQVSQGESLGQAKAAAEVAARQAQEALAGASAELARLREDHATLQQDLAEAQGRTRQLEAEGGEHVQHLAAELEAARTAAAAAEQERSMLQDTQAQLQADLAAMQARAAELEQAARTQAGDTEGRLEALQRDLETAQAEARAELERAQAVWQEERTRLADTGTAHEQARADLQARCDVLEAELQAARDAQGQGRAELESRLSEAEAARVQALAEQQATHRDAIAAYERRLADEGERVATRIAELERALRDAQAGAEEAADQATRLAAFDEERDGLRAELAAQAERAREAETARLEIEARLAEMSAAAEEAQARLEQARREQQETVARAEERLRTELGAQLRDLKSDLEGARAALAREQSQRENLAEADQAERDVALAEAAKEFTRIQADLDAARDSLAQSETSRRALEAAAAAARDEAEMQRQALAAELEQLRAATSADIEATRRQMASLHEELEAARKASAGASADEELSRLRMLLDEAREEANSAHSDAEQWREKAFAAEQTQPDPGDELDAMRIQLADVQSRVDDALRQRDEAQQEVSGLRQQLETTAQAGPLAAAPSQPLASPPGSARRGGGVWMGLAAGLVIGLAGAAGLFWFGGSREAQNAAAAPPAAASSVTPLQRAEQPLAPLAAGAETDKPKVEAKPGPKPEPKPAQPESVAKAAPFKVRTFRDPLRDGGPGPEMVEMPAARFAMGSSASSLEFDERPRHDVQLRRFAIGRYEVTFDEYDAFARATGRRLPDDKGWGRGKRPVIDVSWDDAAAYALWLSEQTGTYYRLPSEAEWEYAAGGGSGALYWWGIGPERGRANCFDCGSEWDARSTAPVGRFDPNPYGLYDTAGNAAEWVQDCYHANYAGAPADGSARLAADCAGRVVRGGGFNSPAPSVRFSKRDQRSPGSTTDDVGFRIARDF